ERGAFPPAPGSAAIAMAHAHARARPSKVRFRKRSVYHRAVPDRPRLVRAIGRWDYTALVVNGVIGSGIFGLPAVLAGLTGAWSPLAYVLAGIGMLAIRLFQAEVGTPLTAPGGHPV